MPSRRHVLVSAAALASTGCLGSRSPATAADRSGTRSESPSGSVSSGPPTEQRPVDDCQSGITVSTDAFAPVEQVVTAVDEPARPIVDDAVGDGSTEGPTVVSTYGRPPIADGVFVRSGDSFYRCRHSQVGRESVPARRLAVQWEAGQDAPDDASTVSYAALPESDRRALRLAVFGPVYERDLDRHPQEGLSVRAFPAPYPDGTADSRIVANGEAWVEWRGRVYHVRVGGETETERRTYRYEFEPIGASPAAFRSFVAAEYLVSLDDLSSAEREIAESAIDERYEECEPGSAALERFRERLTVARELPRPRDGEWYVSYDGDRYLLTISGWVV
ncbi:hypothetical protein [Salinigranum marinum]|uniref:hypothetical protein n=1 Tax=Salinigranum marinum TaxID=1515595 RepID=UPI002989F66D|nr:hypothetical protein [Salinigranum marinum]